MLNIILNPGCGFFYHFYNSENSPGKINLQISGCIVLKAIGKRQKGGVLSRPDQSWISTFQPSAKSYYWSKIIDLQEERKSIIFVLYQNDLSYFYENINFTYTAPGYKLRFWLGLINWLSIAFSNSIIDQLKYIPDNI